MKTILLACTLLLALASFLVLPVSAAEIGFIEDFVLTEDREAVLSQLIPGTEDYYYYNALHQQHAGNWQAYDDVMTAWSARRKEGNRPPPKTMIELRNRAALLRFADDPEAAWIQIRSELSLRFDHTRQVEAKPTYPTTLDPERITAAAFKKDAARHRDYIQRFTPFGLEQLQGEKLDPGQRNKLLRRLVRPDWPGLVDLIVADLKYVKGSSYGSHPIHSKLTLPQLRELAEKQSNVLYSAPYVNEVVKRLSPNADQLPDPSFHADLPARIAALERIWAFAKDLAPVHNSLKLNILNQRLRLDLQTGEISEARFLEYIKIPRNLAYMEPRWLEREEHRNRFANLNQSFPSPCLSPVRGDEGLLREYLEQFFADAKDHKKYSLYLRESFLRDIFASTKILQGKGDVEKWASMLPPSKYKTLKESVEINFRPENPRQLAAADPVVLKVDLKNVPELLVKIYEVNAFNYFREKGAPVDLAINLDGLVASSETSRTYDRQPERRSTETFKFPQLKGRGVWVVEFIGNGVSSRALVQKGRLHAETRSTAAGHGILVRDEKQKVVKTASAWIGGREFEAGKNGLIVVPYSTSPGSAKLVLRDGDFASLVSFPHQAEVYALRCGVHVDHESLQAGGDTELLFRPVLTVNGMPVSPELLQNVRLTIASTDLRGTSSQRVVRDLKLSASEDLVVPFKVPFDLQSLTVTLQAEAENISGNRQDTVQVSKSFAVNQIDLDQTVNAILFTRRGADHFVEVRGLNGEAVPDRPLKLRVHHKGFVEPIYLLVQTDEQGVTKLGALPQIRSVHVDSEDLLARTWIPARPKRELPSAIHGFEQEAVPVALPTSSIDELALFSLATGEYVEDLSAKLKIEKGFVMLPPLPGGDYELVLKSIPFAFPVRISSGERRRLEFINPAPLQIAELKAAAETVDIQLAHAGKHTRVHVFASWYNPAHAPFSNLAGASLPPASVRSLPSARSFYESGRDIGDEYRYILDRQNEPQFAGNLLKRPGLLLNPWAVRETEATEQDAKAGGTYRKQMESIQELRELKAEATESSYSRLQTINGVVDGKWHGVISGGGRVMAPGVFKNINFLAEPGVQLLNLKPDENGLVRIPLADLKGKPQLHVVAIGPRNTVYRSLALDKGTFGLEDQRLKRPLDPAQGYAEQQFTTMINPADGEVEEQVLRDARSAKFALYDSLDRAFELLVTLSKSKGENSLEEFRFVLRWPELNAAEKRAKFSEFACHELSFFLYHKDRPFFDRVVKPYLANKKDKTFLDDWLLGEPLDAYAEPWSFQRLNHVEKILLAGRLPGRSESLARWVQDRTDLISPNLEADKQRFLSAIGNGALGGLGRNKKLMELQGAVSSWKFEGGYDERGNYVGAGGMFSQRGEFVGDSGGYDQNGRFTGERGKFDSKGEWAGESGGYDKNGNFVGERGMYDKNSGYVGLNNTSASGSFTSRNSGATRVAAPAIIPPGAPPPAPTPKPTPEAANETRWGLALGAKTAKGGPTTFGFGLRAERSLAPQFVARGHAPLLRETWKDQGVGRE